MRLLLLAVVIAFVAGALVGAQGKSASEITVKDVNGDCWKIDPKNMNFSFKFGDYVTFTNVACPK